MINAKEKFDEFINFIENLFEEYSNEFPDGELPDWYLSKVLQADRSGIENQIKVLRDRGLEFSIEPNYFAPVNPESLTADERKFLTDNRKPVLCYLQFEVLLCTDNFEGNYVKQFLTDFNRKALGFLNTSGLKGTMQEKAAKALHDTVRRWFRYIQ